MTYFEQEAFQSAAPDISLVSVTLLTGFLGSGKTTVLNHLVPQRELADALVIINEFGEMALDHMLVTQSTENLVMEMSSGCLCCWPNWTMRTRIPGRRTPNPVLLASAGMMGLLQQAPQAALAPLRAAASMPSANWSDDTRINTLLAEREQARRERDFAKADALREKLAAAGFMVEDTRTGPVLRPAEKEPA